MAKRKIINIDDSKCNGCRLCIPNCPEGAIQIIDGKARLISDLFCDGLGACIGYCPQGAITIEEREAAPYDEKKVMANIVKQGPNVIKAHLSHLKSHNELKLLKEATDFLKEKKIKVEIVDLEERHTGCPGSRVLNFGAQRPRQSAQNSAEKAVSELCQWPVQLRIVPVQAAFFNDSDILICADCVPFAYPDFHQSLLKGKVLLVGCPKLDDLSLYKDKLTQIFQENRIKSITYAHMEVPCCFGLIGIIEEAIQSSGKEIPFREINISIKGEKLP